MQTDWRRILTYIRPYRSRVILGTCFTLLLSLSNLPLPLIMQYLIDDVIRAGQWAQLNFVLIMILSLHVIRGLFSFFQTYTITYLGQRLVLDIRHQLFDHLQKLSLSYYDKKQTGKIMSRVMDDVTNIQSMLSSQFITAFTDFVTLFVVIGLLFYKNWALALMSISVVPFYIANRQYFKPRIRLMSQGIRASWDRIFGSVQETMSAVYVVKAFAQEERETKDFEMSTWENTDLNLERASVSIKFSAIAGSISGLGTALVLWYGGYSVIQLEMSTGELIAFYGLVGFLYGPAVRLATLSANIQESLVSVDRVFEILNTKPDVEDEGEIRLPRIKGHVELRNICFGYSPDQFVLDSINLDIEPGMTVAFVGHTGCGKTTLVNIIPRFYDPILGTILIDDYDSRDVTIESLRAQIGIVLQESVLFDASIRNNIRYGKMDASDEEVEQAAQVANIHDYITSLPDGYETRLGEEGTTLSGGQKQRIAIARAIVADPRILIMDEATSALDSQSESLIQEALKNVRKNRTSFVIAHRLSTILDADLIVVMDHGKIIETGTHESLMHLNGLYALLYEEQFKKTSHGNGHAETVLQDSDA
jgi:ATP-binding cassette, subfamily B, bacterial MsbA